MTTALKITCESSKMSLLIRTFLFLLCINYLSAEDEEDLVAVASEFGEKLAEQQLPTKVSTNSYLISLSNHGSHCDHH